MAIFVEEKREKSHLIFKKFMLFRKKLKKRWKKILKKISKHFANLAGKNSSSSIKTGWVEIGEVSPLFCRETKKRVTND